MPSKSPTGLDVEMGARKRDIMTGPVPMARRRRPSARKIYRMPIAAALSAFSVFLFFVWVGRSKSAAHKIGDDKLISPKIDVGQPLLYKYEIMREYDHDPNAFTQGLLYEEKCDESGKNCKEIFYESTGLHGQSTVREVELATGKVLRSKQLPKSDFGEGLTRQGDRLVQVTWQGPKVWSYDADNFEDAKALKTPLKDGWGVTSNGTHLIVGDSSEFLYFLDPDTLEIVEKLKVLDNNLPVRWINELEFIDNLIYGNIYYTDCIAQIDSTTGGVVGWIRMDGLKQHMINSYQGDKSIVQKADVLNGIAFDEKHSRLFVTGKLWPKLYEIQLRPLVADSTDPLVLERLEETRKQCIQVGGVVG